MATSRILSRTLAPLAVLAAFLPVAEIALRAARFDYPSEEQRLVVWSREQDELMRNGNGLHQIDAHEIWKPRPGAHIPWTKDEQVNWAGYRGPMVPLERKKGVLRIATLGSSSTFGVGVNFQDTFSALLVRILGYHGIQAEVIDAGVVNSTIRQGIERYRRLVRQYQPDLVICSYSGISEHLQASRCCSDASRIESGCGMPDIEPGARPRRWLRDDLRIGQALAWLGDVYAGPYWRERDEALQEKRLSKTIGTFDNAGVRRVSITDFQSCIAILSQEVRADGGHLMMLSIPRMPGGKFYSDVLNVYQRVLADTGANEGWPVVSGRIAYFQGVNDGIPIEDLFLEDGFTSECGHPLLAQALVDEILVHLPEYAR